MNDNPGILPASFVTLIAPTSKEIFKEWNLFGINFPGRAKSD
jgi:hypothetical protein